MKRKVTIILLAMALAAGAGLARGHINLSVADPIIPPIGRTP